MATDKELKNLEKQINANEKNITNINEEIRKNDNIIKDFKKEKEEILQQLDTYLSKENIEKALITHREYKEEYDKQYIDELLSKLEQLGCKNVILTGVSYQKGKTGVVIYENGNYAYYFNLCYALY